jgi:hypothetical protein
MADVDPASAVTTLLRAWRGGDQAAFGRLTPAAGAALPAGRAAEPYPHPHGPRDDGRTVLEEVLLHPSARSRRVATLLREGGAQGDPPAAP